MDETLSLRSATVMDAEAIRALTREAYAKWIPIIGREPLPMGTDFIEAVQKHRIDLLHRDDTLVALIEMIPEADHLLIENVAVSPAFQGRGLGQRLLAHAEQTTAALGHSCVKLYTNELFTENLRLYLRLGFQIEREEPFKGGIVVHMSKALDAPAAHP